MGLEIERKYLVTSDEWRNLGTRRYYCQGYLTDDPNTTVRVRITNKSSDCISANDDANSGTSHSGLSSPAPITVRDSDQYAYLTIKGAVKDLVRPEFEYEIPVQDAENMLNLWCQSSAIEKYRYRIPLGDLIWEVDEFLGNNHGLVIAEVELTERDQSINLPTWIGEEVSGDIRYYNSYLAKHPYSTW